VADGAVSLINNIVTGVTVIALGWFGSQSIDHGLRITAIETTLTDRKEIEAARLKVIEDMSNRQIDVLSSINRIDNIATSLSARVDSLKSEVENGREDRKKFEDNTMRKLDAIYQIIDGKAAP
jgi:chromosome condensin MukBEF ATPase and DNA-binding subunit MukB